MAAPERTSAPDDVKHLFQFLVEPEELRTRPVRTLESATRTLWLGDLPEDTPGVISGVLDHEDSDQWLRVERVNRTDPPALPEILDQWIQPGERRDHQREMPPALLEVPLDALLNGGTAPVAEDACTVHIGNAPRALAALRNLANGVLHTLRADNIAKTTRAIRDLPERALPFFGIGYEPDPSGT